MPRIPTATATSLGWLCLATACSTPWVEGESGGFRTLVGTFRSDRGGALPVKIEPERGETAMLVTMRTLDPLLDGHLRFASAGGAEVFSADTEVSGSRAKTNAGYIGHTVTFNWPVTAEDGVLLEQTYALQFGTVDRELTYTRADAEVSVMLKRDLDFTRGELTANVIFTGSTRTDTRISDAVVDAVEGWRRIYAGIGVSLVVTYGDYDHPGVLQGPGQGDLSTYVDISEDTTLGSLNIVVVDDIAGLGDVYGFAGDIPGPLVSSGRSAVAIDAGLGAGTDGAFDDAELQLLSETLAHEVGHFIGLYHPVEVDYASWDALGDTPECATEQACIDEMGQNLMFPFPICNATSCVAQTVITDGQRDVAHRYTGVN